MWILVNEQSLSETTISIDVTGIFLEKENNK